MGVKCPARGTQKSSLGHWGSSWTWGQESLWSQGGLVFLERRGSAGPGQVSLLAAGRALATARGRASCSPLGQEEQLQPSPAAREGESRLGWEISIAQMCLCQAAVPAKGLLLGHSWGDPAAPWSVFF